MSRFLTSACVALLALLVANTVQAAVITIEGTVKSVDAEKRTISVKTKTKTLELDVSRKAKVSVKGKTAELDSLKVGQAVKLDYHDGLEIVLKIDANGAPNVDAKNLEGEWFVVEEELNGRKIARKQRITQNRRLTFIDGKFFMSRVIGGRLGTYEGRITFDFTGDPKQFTFKGKTPGGNPVEWRGIYQLKDETLTLCYKYVSKTGRTESPVAFKTEADAGTPFVLLKLNRDETASAALEASKRDMKLLDGEWVVISEELNGRKLTRKQVVSQNRCLSCMDGKLVVSRVIRGRLGTYEGRITLDPTGDPKQFTFKGKGPGRNPVEWRGIYKIKDEALTLCYKYVSKNGRTKSPVAFKTEANAGTPFVLLISKKH